MKTIIEAVLFLLRQHDTAEDAAGDKARLIAELETMAAEPKPSAPAQASAPTQASSLATPANMGRR